MKISHALIGLALVSLGAIPVFSEDSPHGRLSWDCADCHSTESWNRLAGDMRFTHGKTGWPLIGSHRQVACRTCHEDLVFSHVGTACADCHADHHLGQLGNECQSCHTPQDWHPQSDILLQHAERGFPLTGFHAVTDCDACHRSGDRQEFVGTPTACETCHQSDLSRALDPNHQTLAFDTDCERCHHAAFGGWSRTTYEHPSSFPLAGAHAVLDCSSCHAETFAGTPTDCYSCHQIDYDGTDDPDHELAGFSTECGSCHTTTAWEPVNFDHSQTAFPLTGAHRSQSCKSCHADGYAATPTDCYSCHATDFQSADDPNHEQGGFPHDCTTCHTTNAWEPSTFDHNQTAFPLTGAHISQNCMSCHADGYAGTPTDCYSCHQDDFVGTTDPDHVQNNFSQNCTDCHNTTAWEPSTFDHNQTAFPLTGAHTSQTCISCHSGGYAGTPNDCYSCHQSDYEGTSDPNHIQNGFSQTCTDCHNTTAWEPANFDHAQTSFLLTGEHTSLTCVSCHASGYSGTPTDCYACHQSDYDGTIDPNHQNAGFAQTCQDCHSTTAWEPATFDHSQTSFPLLGAHTTATCIACHPSSYSGTPTLCYACHQSDYETTTDPSHAASQFPTTCDDCHTTNGWSPSTWDHDALYFPIYSGAHNGRWDNCTDCHTIPSDFGSFSCIDCHEHNQTETDGHHNGVNDYQYLSSACYSCHPTGRH